MNKNKKELKGNCPDCGSDTLEILNHDYVDNTTMVNTYSCNNCLSIIKETYTLTHSEIGKQY